VAQTFSEVEIRTCHFFYAGKNRRKKRRLVSEKEDSFRLKERAMDCVATVRRPSRTSKFKKASLHNKGENEEEEKACSRGKRRRD